MYGPGLNFKIAGCATGSLLAAISARIAAMIAAAWRLDNS
jgi:hypothetical protein